MNTNLSSEHENNKKKKPMVEVYENPDSNFLTVLNSILEDSSNPNYTNAYTRYLRTKIMSSKDTETHELYQKKLETFQKRGSITQEDIALITGHNKSTVSRWLNRHDTKIPSAETIARLAGALNVSCDYLLGVSGTAHIDEEKEYKVFEKYGIDPKAFLNLKAFYKETKGSTFQRSKVKQTTIDYDKTIAGLNLLLKEVNEHGRMDILSRIGYFLTQHRFDNYYYFDNDDVENLYDSLFKNISAEDFTEEHVKYYLDGFLSNSPQFTIDDRVLVSLDTIRDRLKEYKELIDPEFFKASNAPLFFPSKETYEFVETFNDDEIIYTDEQFNDEELIDMAFIGRNIDIE